MALIRSQKLTTHCVAPNHGGRYDVDPQWSLVSQVCVTLATRATWILFYRCSGAFAMFSSLSVQLRALKCDCDLLLTVVIIKGATCNCDCSQQQTMSHIVDVCPLTKFDGGLQLLHEAEDDAVTSGWRLQRIQHSRNEWMNELLEVVIIKKVNTYDQSCWLSDVHRMFSVF